MRTAEQVGVALGGDLPQVVEHRVGVALFGHLAVEQDAERVGTVSFVLDGGTTYSQNVTFPDPNKPSGVFAGFALPDDLSVLGGDSVIDWLEHFGTEGGKPAVVGHGCTVADAVAAVVGELDHPHAEVGKDLHTLGICSQLRGILEAIHWNKQAPAPSLSNMQGIRCFTR